MPLFDDHDDNTTSGPVSNSSINLTPFLLADIGEGISEVEVLRWNVSPGDTVAQFDLICEVQSDKANVEITSRYDGVVESLCGAVGDMVFVGKPLMYIATEIGVGGGEEQTQEDATRPTVTLNNVDDDQDRLSVSVSVPSAEGARFTSGDKETRCNTIPETWSPREHAVSASTTKVLTSPAVRKLGKENNIDLTTILGTGPGGRVLKADILEIINTNSSSTKTSHSSTQEQIEPPTSTPNAHEEDTVIPIRGYNRLMVKSMTSSLTIPHMVYSDEINVNALTEVRDTLRPLAQEMGIPKLSYMPFFIKAASLALLKYPVLNSTMDTENMTLTYHTRHDVGVAVDTERGLAVPVVKGCESRSVLEIATELARLYTLAAEGNLSEPDIISPTFTLSNIGAIGGTYMSPIVLPPQVAIGAMGKIQRLPRYINDNSDEVEAARIMPISWGGDHRAIDGATMARFSNLWKSYCENPSMMMFAMR